MQEQELQHLRHSLAHLLGAAVLELYPESKLTLGPAVDNGFYYDIDVAGKIGEDDLPKIEARMQEMIVSWSTFSKQVVDAETAQKTFAENQYKHELIGEIVEKGEEISLYTSGQFTDLCRGGHIDDMQKIKASSWKLDRVAGSYWRGSEKNKMLTRIYGLAFESKEKLDAYILQIQEAKKRDHRKLGKELGLFSFSELVGPGLPLWSPKGTVIRELLNDYVWELRKNYGYEKVTIPHITKKDLYEKSGHWAKYADDLFKIHTREDHVYVMKPMNCPHHTQIYDAVPRSYKDLPQRYSETTMVYRDEQSGELSGLSRVLSITQDDSHVFCRMNQIQTEVESVWQIVESFYGVFGFTLIPRLSRRNLETPEKYLGKTENWDMAEATLKNVITSHTEKWTDGPGEAAFYGPKIDFMAYDSIGREWQVATIQLDFVQPERFELVCTNEKGEKEGVVMLHVAIMGSIERFMSILIEHLAGVFPVWLSPLQVSIIPVRVENHFDYAKEVLEQLRECGVRVEINSSDDSLGKRINGAKAQKVPYVIVIGDKEKESGKLTIEGRGEKVEMNIENFVEKITGEIKNRSLN